MATAILGDRHVGARFMEESRRGELDLDQLVNFINLDLDEPEPKAAVAGGVKVSEAGAGDKAGVIVFKDGKKMELVSQEYIEILKADLPNRKPIRPVDHKLLDSLKVDTKIREMYRRSAVGLFHALKEARDCEDDILRQYETTGRAFVPYDE